MCRSVFGGCSAFIQSSYTCEQQGSITQVLSCQKATLAAQVQSQS